MTLPTVRLMCLSKNPNWVFDKDLPYEDRMRDYHVRHETEAEILTLHLQKNKMRIRYRDACGKVQTQDIDASSFFQKYEIVKKY
jgi:hypothetical protein